MPRLLWMLLLALPVRAQDPVSNGSGSGGGGYDVGGYGTVALTPGGFALGGGVRHAVHPSRRIVLDAHIGGVSDEREVRFSGPGGAAIPSKYEYLLLVPARIGVEQRLFSRQIEDNVRPFVRASAGPTLALAHPYFADCNANQRYERRTDCNGDGVEAPGEGEEVLPFSRSLSRARPLVGGGATLAAGVHLGRSRRGLQSVSVAYRIDYLPDGAQLLEPDVRPRQRWFFTPDLALTLRLF